MRFFNKTSKAAHRRKEQCRALDNLVLGVASKRSADDTEAVDRITAAMHITDVHGINFNRFRLVVSRLSWNVLSEPC